MANICVTYFDNTNVDFDAYKESLQQSRAEWDEETTDVTEEEIWDNISECEQAAWEDFLSGLNMSKYSNVECVVLGEIRRWNGTFQIDPTPCRDLESAIAKCINECDYFAIVHNGGYIKVMAEDHDGASTFEIHLLNKKGIEAYERICAGYGSADLSLRCYHKALTERLF